MSKKLKFAIIGIPTVAFVLYIASPHVLEYAENQAYFWVMCKAGVGAACSA